MAKIAVVGVGAIGSVTLAAFELTGRHDLLLCTRRPMERLLVETPAGPVSVNGTNLVVASAKSDSTHADWVIVATKAYDAVPTAKWFDLLCGPQTKVAIIQNGVEHRARFAPFFDESRLLPVIIDCPAEKRADGSVLQRAWAKMTVEDTPMGHEFAGLFSGSHAVVELANDFTTPAWKKLCHNSQGALSAITLLPNRVLQVTGMEMTALGIIRECVAVGCACGATIENGFAESVIAAAKVASPDGTNSMLADRIAGRLMEIDARNGAIVRFGELHGVPTPLNGMVAALLRALEDPSLRKFTEPQ